jgi:hypothetical protein
MAGKYVYSDLGHCDRGEVIEVTLSGNAANVRLVDSSNYNAYRQGRRHQFVGGLAKKSPVRLAIPQSGRWYGVVDMQGLGGSTRASFRKLPQALPELRERPLSSIPSLIRNESDLASPSAEQDVDFYDVFISHASEDKEDVARPLAEALQVRGFSVWYDDFSLRMGDSLRRSIDRGVARSRFGVVILSPNFFRKNWTQYELDGLVTRTMADQQHILPIWHEVTKQEVIDYSPSLADKLARSTGSHTIAEIAEEIMEVIVPVA